jgi:hypothetical protein
MCLLPTKAVFSADEQYNCLCDNTSMWRYCQPFGEILKQVNNCIMEKNYLMQELMYQLTINWWMSESNYDKERIIELQQLQIESLKKCADQPPQPQSNISAGNEKLIVVSLSTNLKEKGGIIRKSLIEVFSELKKRESKTPFNLLTLQTGRQLYTLLTDQELQSLPIEGEESLLSRIEMTMNFGATDLRALADLSLVDNMLQEQASIGHILYLTDNTKMSENPQEIPSQQRGVPLVWHKDGIALTVLTIKACQVWEYMEAKCVIWQNETDLTRELNTFLHQGD